MALTREQKLQRKKDYYYANKSVVLERNRQYYLSHREQIMERRKQYHKEYYKKNRDKIVKRTNEYNKNNRNRVSEWARNRRRVPESWKKIRISEDRYRKKECERNPAFKISLGMSKNINKCLNGKKCGRRWEKLVGYTAEELVEHLERMFTTDMNWKNYGSYWHVDHIIPKSYFYYEKPEDEEFLMCWNYTNLQPMRAIDNIKKSNKYIG